MESWTRFTEWCQRPSKIKIRTFNPRNVVILATSFIIFTAASINILPLGLPKYLGEGSTTGLNPEDIETLIITTDTTLTEDYFNTTIYISADNVTLDGNGHRIIGPSPAICICYHCYPNATIYPNSTTRWSDIAGIYLEGRTGVTIKNCRITGFAFGFLLQESDRNTLQGNTVYDNDNCGFFLHGSDRNTLQGNTVYDNPSQGFLLQSSSNNILLNNTVNGNGHGYAEGFFIQNDDVCFSPGFSSGNTFQGNTVTDCWRGFGFDECDGNICFHNTLIRNTIQADGSPRSENTWDDGSPSGGNYWNDYTGVDADGDGIGDTPYVIDENNVDRFPLMAPISVFDINTTGGETDKE